MYGHLAVKVKTWICKSGKTHSEQWPTICPPPEIPSPGWTLGCSVMGLLFRVRLELRSRVRMISGGTKCPGCKCPAFARACRNTLVAVENIGCQLALCTRQTPAANVRSLQIRLLPIFSACYYPAMWAVSIATVAAWFRSICYLPEISVSPCIRLRRKPRLCR